MKFRLLSIRTTIILEMLFAFGTEAIAATVIYVNFDTPKDVTWKRPVRDPITGDVVEREFMKTTTPSGLDATQKAQIMARMAGRYAGTGVTFTDNPANPHTKTLDFTGGSTPPEIGKKLFGTTALDHNAAWVFVGELAGAMTHGPAPRPLTPTEIANALSHTADHEVGHMMGLGHRWDQSLMTVGTKVTWTTRINGLLIFSAADSTALDALDDVDDHASAVQPGAQHGLQLIYDLAQISEEEALRDDLFVSAEVFASGPADLSGFQYGTLNANGDFLIVGELDNILLGSAMDVFTMGSGESFQFALRSAGGTVYSELDDNISDLQLSVPVGPVFQLASFSFDFDPMDGDPSSDATVILSAGLLDIGSGFIPAPPAPAVPLLGPTSRPLLILLMTSVVLGTGWRSRGVWASPR